MSSWPSSTTPSRRSVKLILGSALGDGSLRYSSAHNAPSAWSREAARLRRVEAAMLVAVRPQDHPRATASASTRSPCISWRPCTMRSTYRRSRPSAKTLSQLDERPSPLGTATTAPRPTTSAGVTEGASASRRSPVKSQLLAERCEQLGMGQPTLHISCSSAASGRCSSRSTSPICPSLDGLQTPPDLRGASRGTPSQATPYRLTAARRSAGPMRS